MWLYGSYQLILAVWAFVFAVMATGLVRRALLRAKVLDVPNARSNHAAPVPRGGGWGMVLAMAVFLPVIADIGHLVVAMLGLAVVSFWDDIRGLAARWRLLAQAIAVAACLWLAFPYGVFDWMPDWLELPLLALAWLWFINLFNFMDGSDGLASSEAVSICAGILVLTLFVALPLAAKPASLVVLGAAFGFLLWNWPPARIFMGDVGSIPLGFVLGYLLILVAAGGHWAAAVILPAVFVADATLTLACRLKRRERIFEAHSSHAYQQAIRGGLSHGSVARRVVEMNLVLISLAVLSAVSSHLLQVAIVVVAYAAVFWLLRDFRRQDASATPNGR